MARWGFNTGLDGHRVTLLDEHAAEEIADALGYIYEQANQRMLKNVAARLARGVTTYGWAERKAGEVGAAHRQLEGDLAQARRERLSLLDGLAERCAMSGSQKFYQDIGSMLGNTAHISPNSQKAAYILADMNNTLNAAERRILRQFDDRYADVIGRVSSEFATGVMNTRQAVGDALRAFADQGISGFIDRGGHHWTLRDYSEMAVLTAIERATLSSYVDTMQSYGFDLAVIDGHAGSCPICTAWEGVIVSVSGEDHRYPSLGEAENEGVFHPRCVHGITTYYEGITHAPRGGFRDHPRAVQQPNAEYTARSQQRYMERQIRKYKDRLIVAQTPQQRQMAQNKIREWTRELDKLIDKQPASNYLYRHRDREIANRLTSTSNSGTLGIKQTGGKTPLWLDDKRQALRESQATKAYDAIRSADDIAAISKASGLSEQDVQMIKDHVFFAKHNLYDGYETLSPDYDMAVAWKRLADGEPEDRDITLLRHELAEAIAEANGAKTLSEAHQIANQQFDWESQLLKEKGEEGEEDGLL